MFEGLPQEFVSAIVYLLPGFVCAWAFYGLTCHPKPSQFERLVQALIFTFIIRASLGPVQWSMQWIGGWVAIRPWDESASHLASLLLALLMGSVFAYVVNTDALHGWLRKFQLTTRTSHPSEWFYIFSQKVTFVILHLADGRRLYGWPKEWPIEHNKGQFYIMLPAWILEDGSQLDLPELDGILIQTTDVKWVEFVHDNGDRT